MDGFIACFEGLEDPRTGNAGREPARPAPRVTTETAYYLLSMPLSADRFGQVARSHWAVENSLHWCLDVIMNEDNARNRLDSGPYNLAILRHMALNLIRKEPSKGSLRVKIKRAGWKDEYLAKVLAQI